MLHIKLPNPRDPRRGLSPLASARGLVELDLAEQDARLRRAGMPPVMVKRPMDAPKWGDAARMPFEERITALLKGARRGSVPTLEEGMELAPVPGPSEADYVASRQFVLTTICAVLGVPAQSASVTDRNLDAAHRALYTDAIGPLTQIIADHSTPSCRSACWAPPRRPEGASPPGSTSPPSSGAASRSRPTRWPRPLAAPGRHPPMVTGSTRRSRRLRRTVRRDRAPVQVRRQEDPAGRGGPSGRA